MKNKPYFNNNEEVVLTSLGFYKSNLRSGWKPGHGSWDGNFAKVHFDGREGFRHMLWSSIR